MSKCIGCGAPLQIESPDMVGYTKSLDNLLCERCFRIKNYSDYKIVIKTNNDFLPILNKIAVTSSLVVLVVDLFHIPRTLEALKQYLPNDVLLVLTKRDLLPRFAYDVKLKEYFKRYSLNVVDTIIISSMKNYHFDTLIAKIREYQKDKNVYVVGFTNAGKSTMINRLIYNYGSTSPNITTSFLPTTTIDTIEIALDDDLTLIDTPGLLEEGNIINYIDPDIMKQITPQKEIKPITYQIKEKQTIVVDDFVRVDCYEENSLTFYMANALEFRRIFKETDALTNLEKHHLKVSNNNDIVISGLGFIKVVNEGVFDIYTIKGVDVYTRDALI